MNSNYKLIPVDDQAQWIEALELCGKYDTYHLPSYHLLAQKQEEGKPFLFFFQSELYCAAIPFLVRPISPLKGLEDSRLFDVTSVYGYPGIITSVKEGDKNAGKFKTNFQAALIHIFEKLSAVTFFSRTNPLFRTNWLFRGMTENLVLSSTVGIDLSLTEEQQLRAMTKGHRYDVRKAQRLGVTIVEDYNFDDIDDFIQIYNETMKRNEAREDYYFSKNYYLQLKKLFKESIKLYFAKYEDKPVSASIFFMTGRIIQYHLSGTLKEFFHLNGAKLILDTVRRIGTQKGFSWLHLGGGVGSSEDNLFKFKAGFSKVRLPFEVVRLVVDPIKYAELIKKRKKWLELSGNTLLESDFFPDYRRPYQSNIKI